MKKWATAAVLFLFAGAQAASADGGKLAFSGTDHAAERALILKTDKFLGKYVAKGLVKESEIGIALSDLAGDGTPAILVYTQSSMTCGSRGCSFMIYRKHGGDMQRVLNMTAYSDVAVAPGTSNGMHDIILQDGKGQPVTFRFDGRAYKL